MDPTDFVIDDEARVACQRDGEDCQSASRHSETHTRTRCIDPYYGGITHTHTDASTNCNLSKLQRACSPRSVATRCASIRFRFFVLGNAAEGNFSYKST